MSRVQKVLRPAVAVLLIAGCSERTPPTAARFAGWTELCESLRAPDYDARVEEEARCAQDRMEWASAWRPLLRRIEMRLVDCGLAPLAVIGE